MAAFEWVSRVFESLFALAAAQLDIGAGVVLEANFRTAEAAEDLAPLLAGSRAVAIYCWVPMETVLERVRRPPKLEGVIPATATGTASQWT